MRAESTSNTQVVSLIPSAMISYIHPRCQCSLLVPVAFAIGLAQRSTFCAFVNLRPDKLWDPALCWHSRVTSAFHFVTSCLVFCIVSSAGRSLPLANKQDCLFLKRTPHSHFPKLLHRYIDYWYYFLLTPRISQSFYPTGNCKLQESKSVELTNLDRDTRWCLNRLA